MSMRTKEPLQPMWASRSHSQPKHSFEYFTFFNLSIYRYELPDPLQNKAVIF